MYAKTTSAVQLALTKAVTEMSLSLLGAVTLVICSNTFSHDATTAPDSIMAQSMAAGEYIQSFVDGFGTMVQGEDSSSLLTACGATIWIGLVTVAYSKHTLWELNGVWQPSLE